MLTQIKERTDTLYTGNVLYETQNFKTLMSTLIFTFTNSSM